MPIHKTLPSYTNGVALLGDSITENLNSFLLVASAIFGYSVKLKSGHSGKRSDELLQWVPDVIASGAKHCLIQCGSNDIGQFVPASVFKQNLINLFDALILGGVEPEMCYMPTHNTEKAHFTAYQNAIYQACSFKGIKLYNPWDGMFEPNGDWLLLYSGDGIHPNITAASIAGGRVSDKMKLPKGDIPYPMFIGGGGLISNPIFYGDSNADGIADNWSKGGAVTGSASLVASVNGNKQKIVLSGAGAGEYQLYEVLSGITPGDKIRIVAKVKNTSLVNCSVSIFLRCGGGGIDIFAVQYCPCAGDFIFETVGVIPEGTNTPIAFFEISSSGSASGTVEIESFDVVNLTALGID